jgi:hypothetical protein
LPKSAEPIGVAGFVCEKHGTPGKMIEQFTRRSQIMGMSRCDSDLDWQSVSISNGMDFGGETTATSTKAAILMVRPERCR